MPRTLARNMELCLWKRESSMEPMLGLIKGISRRCWQQDVNKRASQGWIRMLQTNYYEPKSYSNITKRSLGLFPSWQDIYLFVDCNKGVNRESIVSRMPSNLTDREMYVKHNKVMSSSNIHAFFLTLHQKEEQPWQYQVSGDGKWIKYFGFYPFFLVKM